MANRVTESIISTTSSPRSRNHSAIRVAVNAALIRTMAGASEVATTTTERAMPSGPRSRSMNSATSRPRSPISATTETFASVPRAIIDRSDDFPTPDPAKMPNRWPLPHGIRPSSTRTPRGSCSLTIPLRSGWGTPLHADLEPAQSRSPVHRAAQAVQHAPEEPVTDEDRERPADGCGRRPGPQPGGLAECHADRLAVPHRDHLGLQGPVVGEEQESVTDHGGYPADLDGHAHHLVHPPIGPRPGSSRRVVADRRARRSSRIFLGVPDDHSRRTLSRARDS